MFLPMIIALISIILPSCFSLAATIDNTKPRRDIHGQLMDIHDGNVIKVGDLYHWQVKHFFYRQVTEICIRQRHTPGKIFLFRNSDAHQNRRCHENHCVKSSSQLRGECSSSSSIFLLMNALVYVDIDQGIHQEKNGRTCRMLLSELAGRFYAMVFMVTSICASIRISK